MIAPILLALAASPPAEGQARPRGEWAEAYDARRGGRLLPLPEIERRVVPQVPGAQYLGVETMEGGIYTLKFLRGGAVIWLDVDGRSGQIIRRIGR